MKILLDECLHHKLRKLLVGHETFSAKFMGWDGIKNGALLKLAAEHGFDCVLTCDKSIPYQQNIATLPVALVVMIAPTTTLESLSPLIPQLLLVLKILKPKTFITVKK